MAFDVDFFVIGAGSGGVRAARVAAGHGARVMIAEEFRVGGTCVIRGCVPKKLYVYASRFADDFHDAKGYGWSVPDPVFDWRGLVDAKEKEITRLSGAYRANLDKAGVELIAERAEIVGPHEVRLAEGRRVSARHILVATGARPSLSPAIPGLEHAISSNEIFDLSEFPRRLLVVGSGYIACEFASIFKGLGAKVTQVFRADRVLRGFDADLRAHLGEALGAAGVDLRPGRLPTRIERTAQGLRVTLTDGGLLDVDQALVATGRKPNTNGLGLEAAGVALSPDGGVKVDANGASSVASIHAVGDVSSRVLLTPVAIREGHALADRLFGRGAPPLDYDLIASAVFTTPEIGTIGLSEERAVERYGTIDIFKTDFRPMRATLGGGPERMFMKLVVDAESCRVVGAHLMGHDSGEIIQTLAVAITMGAKKSDLDRTVAVHPTAAEELVTMRMRTARRVREAAQAAAS